MHCSIIVLNFDPQRKLIWSVLMLALVRAASIDAVPIRLQHFQNCYGFFCNLLLLRLLTAFPAKVYSITEYGDREYVK